MFLKTASVVPRIAASPFGERELLRNKINNKLCKLSEKYKRLKKTKTPTTIGSSQITIAPQPL